MWKNPFRRWLDRRIDERVRRAQAPLHRIGERTSRRLDALGDRVSNLTNHPALGDTSDDDRREEAFRRRLNMPSDRALVRHDSADGESEAPPCGPLTPMYAAALARRTSAEAALLEFQLKQELENVGLEDRSAVAENLRLEWDANVRTASIIAASEGGAPVLTLTVRGTQLSWLAEQLLAAQRELDERRG